MDQVSHRYVFSPRKKIWDLGRNGIHRSQRFRRFSLTHSRSLTYTCIRELYTNVGSICFISIILYKEFPGSRKWHVRWFEKPHAYPHPLRIWLPQWPESNGSFPARMISKNGHACILPVHEYSIGHVHHNSRVSSIAKTTFCSSSSRSTWAMPSCKVPQLHPSDEALVIAEAQFYM